MKFVLFTRLNLKKKRKEKGKCHRAGNSSIGPQSLRISGLGLLCSNNNLGPLMTINPNFGLFYFLILINLFLGSLIQI